jgi:hypothetical protein
MKISQYKAGLSENGIKMFDNIRDAYQLEEVKDMILLRIAAENWESMIKTRQEINDSDAEGKPPHSINKEAKAQLMSALEKLHLWNHK